MPLSLVAEGQTAEWLRFWDASEQRHYYFHPSSEESAWVLPDNATFVDGDEESAAAADAVSSKDTGHPSPQPLTLPPTHTRTILAPTLIIPETITATERSNGVAFPRSNLRDVLEPMRESARSFEAEVAATSEPALDMFAGARPGWLPADRPPCDAGLSCVDQDEIHFITFGHPRALLEKKGLVVPMQERIAGAAAAAVLSSAAKHTTAVSQEQDAPPQYDTLEEVRIRESSLDAHNQAQAGRRLSGPFGGGGRGGMAAEAGDSPSSTAGRITSGDRLSMLSGLMDEAAQDADQARECAESGRKERAVDLYREAAAKLLSIVDAHGVDLGGALRQDLEGRVAKYFEDAESIVAKLDRARMLRNHTVKELRDSEKSYLGGLREMQSIYHAQIRADLESVAPVVQRHHEDIVFGQLLQLISHSQHLHRRLCDLVPEQQPGAPGASAVNDDVFRRVLGVLDEKLTDLDVYEKYVEKLGEAMSVSDMWNNDEESGFRSFERNQPRPLSSYQILPFQRITRYPLMLDNLVKASQDLGQAEELERLAALLATTKSAAERANLAKARGENLRRIQAQLRERGVSGNVRCVWQGVLTVVAASGVRGGDAKRRYFLFNDGMVVSEDDVPPPAAGAGGVGTNLVRRQFERVEDISALEFKMQYRSGEADTLLCASQQEKEGWIKELHFADVRGVLRKSSRGGQNEAQALDDIWAKYDTDQDGFITKEELRAALQSECRITQLETADNIFRQLDRNGDGKITKEEFQNALVVHGGLRKAAPWRVGSLVPALTCRRCCCLMVGGCVMIGLLWFYVFFQLVSGILAGAAEVEL